MAEEKSFFDRVYEVVRQVPKGRVTSYGAIAQYLASGRSARMVGWAMNNCYASGFSVPAHRVVNRNGLLTGRNNFATQNLMQELLESEGIKVENDRVVNFSVHFWDPNKELRY